MIFGECDSCRTRNRVLHAGLAYGVEGAFCRACHYDALIEDEDDLLDEIDTLKPKAETGEQWAHLCALYQALTEMRELALEGRLETARIAGRCSLICGACSAALPNPDCGHLKNARDGYGSAPCFPAA